MRRPAVGALLAAWLLLLCITAPQAAGGPYRFRQAAQPGMVTPATDLLDTQERAFIAGLPVLRVGLNLPDNRPYEVIAENGEISGIQIEILTRLAQSMGLRLEPVVLPTFSAALDALRERRIDVMATVGYEPTREAYMAYTLGTAPNPGAVLGRQADNRLTAEPSLNGRRVAIERGYVTRYYVQRLYPDALISERDDTADALRAVALGEDDYYFGSLMMALDRLQRDGIGGLAVKRSMTYATGQMHFGVRSDWPLLASALSKGVAAVRPSPMPALQAALDSLGSQAAQLPKALVLRPEEQRQLAGRSVLRVGAVRGLTLLNEATASGGHAGIAADYTGEVAARLGTAVDVVPFDSVADMLDALRAGRIHLVPFLTRTPARAREFSFSDPYLEMPYQIVARSDAPLYWDLNSLRGKRLALAAQHPLRELLAERYPDIRVVDAPSGQAAMDLVAAGDADAAVEAKLYANLRINSDNNGVLRQVARVDELPAPLQAITLALARMGSGALDEAQRALWQMAQQASTTLVQLIDDVLDLAHYESGRLRLQPAPVALAALLQQIVEPHRLAAQARGLALQLQLSPALPGQASLDALRLRQLLANLIGNAVKYTPTGRVLVCAAPDGDGGAPAGPGNGWLRLTVQDTGVGIPPERQAQLFTPFGMPQSGGLAAGERSHGLGLAICKRLVQAMQGEISLASQPGQGTEVVLRLPLLVAPAQVDDGPIAAAGLPLPVRDGGVLLVDDDALSRLLLAELLRAAGYAVIEAADAEQGLALWRAQPVAAVISDRHMPGTDGPALLQRIADEALASGRRPPCRILCTGDAGDHAALLVDAVLDKPVTLAALHRALQAGGVHPGAAVAN